MQMSLDDYIRGRSPLQSRLAEPTKPTELRPQAWRTVTARGLTHYLLLTEGSPLEATEKFSQMATSLECHSTTTESKGFVLHVWDVCVTVPEAHEQGMRKARS